MPLGDVQKFSNRPKRHRWSGPLRRHMWLSFWEPPLSWHSLSFDSNKFFETGRRTSRMSLWLPLLVTWLFHHPITLWFFLLFIPKSELRWANFFRDATKSQFLKPGPRDPFRIVRQRVKWTSSSPQDKALIAHQGKRRSPPQGPKSQQTRSGLDVWSGHTLQTYIELLPSIDPG